MAYSTYKISYVSRGMERLWRDFWMNGEPTEEAKEASRNGALGQVDFVTAKNLEDAIAQVAKKRPNFTVMREGSSRIGAKR